MSRRHFSRWPNRATAANRPPKHRGCSGAGPRRHRFRGSGRPIGSPPRRTTGSRRRGSTVVRTPDRCGACGSTARATSPPARSPAAHLPEHPEITVHLESGSEVVIVEGRRAARRRSDADRAHRRRVQPEVPLGHGSRRATRAVLRSETAASCSVGSPTTPGSTAAPRSKAPPPAGPSEQF